MTNNINSFEFRELRSEIGAIDDEEIFRKRLGTGSLEDEIKNPIFDLIRRLELADKTIGKYSSGLLEEIKEYFNRLITYLVSVRRMNDSEYISKGFEIRQEIKNLYTESSQWWSKVYVLNSGDIENSQIGFVLKKLEEKLAEKTKEVDELSKNLKQNIDNIKTQREESTKSLEDINGLKTSLTMEVENFNKRYSEVFSKAEFLKQEDIFSKEAQNNKINAKWLFAGIVLIFLGIIIIICSFLNNLCLDASCITSVNEYSKACPDCSKFVVYFQLYKSTALKIFLLSILIYLLKTVVSLYKAQLHNAAVNTHKANSFAAALVLFDKISNEVTRDKIMSIGAETIFKHISTGFINPKEKDSEYINIIDKLLSTLNKKE